MIDSNVFIYVLFSDPVFGERARELLKKAESLHAYTSTLLISQVFAHLERRKRLQVIPTFITYVKQSGIEVVETTWSDITGALELLAEKGLSLKLWDDAVTAYQMKRLGIDTIYSNDADFDVLGVKREF
mgnify:CR=1 FL=1